MSEHSRLPLGPVDIGGSLVPVVLCGSAVVKLGSVGVPGSVPGGVACDVLDWVVEPGRVPGGVAGGPPIVLLVLTSIINLGSMHVSNRSTAQ